MSTSIFIGRKKELEKLQRIHGVRRLNLVVVKGRRRIGKSRLINEFASRNSEGKFWGFAGLAPEEGMTEQKQLDHFGRQLALLLKVPPLSFQDWTDAFEYLSLHLSAGDIVLFDEISWMGSKDPIFVPKLKAWWDKQTIPVMLVFCGSVSTWIEKNILASTAFFGRVNLTISLEPLSISESAQLLKVNGFQGSPYDTYKLLSILGGIPWYLEQVTSGLTADALIKQLCFEKDGLLVNEFDRIFHDLFNGKGTIYKRILHLLKDGMRKLSTIRNAVCYPKGGTFTTLMEHLITAGFVKKHIIRSFKTGKALKQSLYRISDPYMRFYLKMIEPYKDKIDAGGFDDVVISQLPGFDAHIGLQIEMLLLQNQPLLMKALGLSYNDLVLEGPYRQSKTLLQKGCQIDYLVQTLTKNIFVCEFKSTRRELGTEIISEVDKKMRALRVPRGFAIVPALFHMGGVTSSVATKGFFYRIIDIADFLELEDIHILDSHLQTEHSVVS